MFITANYNAPMGIGDSQLIYERYRDGYPVSHSVNIGNWREISQWGSQLRGYIDQALMRQMYSDSSVDTTYFDQIILLAQQIRERAVPDALREQFATSEAVTLRPHSGFARHLPWEAMAIDGDLFGAGGFAIDPGVPQPPRHSGASTGLLILDPTASFKDRQVQAHFEQVRENVRAAGLDVLEVRDASYGLLREQLANPSLALIYFFGHIDRADNGDGQLVLSGDTRLTAREVAQTFQLAANVVILNGCDATGAAPNQYGLEALSMAEAFAHAGAQFISGASQRISWQSAIAADCALVFPYMAGRITAADAALQMRRESMARFQSGEPDFSWAVMRVLANPLLTVEQALLAQGQTTEQVNDWPNVAREVIELANIPGVTDLHRLQQRIVRDIAPSLIDNAPRISPPAPAQVTDSQMKRYLKSFSERYPGGGIDALVKDLLSQGEWDSAITGLSESGIRMLLRHEELLVSFAPITTEARRLLLRATELSLANRWGRLTNRAALAALMEAPRSYLARVCDIDASEHAAISDLLEGMIHQAPPDEPAALAEDEAVSVLTRWLTVANRLRNTSSQIDERALAVAFCQVVDEGLKSALAQLPAPYHLNLDAAMLRPREPLAFAMQELGSIAPHAVLSESTLALLAAAHERSCQLGHHPMSLAAFIEVFFAAPAADTAPGDELYFPLDADALPPALLTGMKWALGQYGELIERNELVRGMWLHSPRDERRASRVVSHGHPETVESAMLLCPDTGYLLHCLDEASRYASAQQQAEIRLPHLYAAVLALDTKAFCQQLNVPLNYAGALAQQLIACVVPGKNPLTPRTASTLSDSTSNKLTGFLASQEGGAFDANGFRFSLATPSHVVVEAILLEFQEVP